MFVGIIKESYLLLNEMSLYLLFGFTVAGILHVFISSDIIVKNLNKNEFASVFKAALFGIPLPLCSCAVIPAAVSIKKAGAGRGAVLSFLISTPATGVDSILVTYSLLGMFFAFFRVIFSFITAMIAGVLADFVVKDPILNKDDKKAACCCQNSKPENILMKIIKHIFTITEDTWKSIFLGVIAGGIVSYLVPSEWVVKVSDNSLISMLLMCVVSVPLYICASSSVPVAAVLIMKGLSPGAAFVFLLAGPATNTATISVVANQLGLKTLLVYLFSIVFCSIGSGLIINSIFKFFDISFIANVENHMDHANNLWGNIGTIGLFILVISTIIYKYKK